MSDIRSILSRYWGYDCFRPLQEEIITSVVNGHDTLGLLPTGGGKSITFQVPALYMGGLTLVVTPLISLMKDQVDNLARLGVKALYLHSGLSRREHSLALDKCRLGKVSLLYVSPEKLQSERFVEDLRLMDVRLIVVDEAHCISQWGYDFRPSYLLVHRVRSLFPEAPLLALTASATPDVANDIIDKLEFRPGFNRFAMSFDRPNISYIVRHGDNKDDMMLRILGATVGSAIVYVRSRRRTLELAALLSRKGISADFYHAGLSSEDKEEKQSRWKSDMVRVMVATNAFGMGIDKPDVRTVIHYDMPSSLEEYYQEAGRAGRDGRNSYAVLLASSYDKAALSRRLSESFPEKEYIKRVYELVGNFLDVAVGSGYGHMYEFDLAVFCQRFNLRASIVRSALHILTNAGYIQYLDEISTRSRVMVILSKDELYALKVGDTADRVLQLLLRTYTGLFADYVDIDESLIAARLSLSQQDVYSSLLELGREHALHYIPRRTTPYIIYTTSRELPKYVTFPVAVYEEQKERMENRLESMKRFAFSSSGCRVGVMLGYFGEETTGRCGKCDCCRDSGRAKSGSVEDIRRAIAHLASSRNGCSLQYAVSMISASPEAIADVVRKMVDDGSVLFDGTNIVIEHRV